MLIVNAFPPTGDWYAVVADEDGNPKFWPVACWAAFDAKDGRFMCGMIADSGHIEPADRLPEHVGYTQNTDPTPWVETCTARRGEIAAEQAKAGKPQIIVPEKKNIRVFDN